MCCVGTSCTCWAVRLDDEQTTRMTPTSSPRLCGCSLPFSLWFYRSNHPTLVVSLFPPFLFSFLSINSLSCIMDVSLSVSILLPSSVVCKLLTHSLYSLGLPDPCSADTNRPPRVWDGTASSQYIAVGPRTSISVQFHNAYPFNYSCNQRRHLIRICCLPKTTLYTNDDL